MNIAEPYCNKSGMKWKITWTNYMYNSISNLEAKQNILYRKVWRACHIIQGHSNSILPIAFLYHDTASDSFLGLKADSDATVRSTCNRTAKEPNAEEIWRKMPRDSLLPQMLIIADTNKDRNVFKVRDLIVLAGHVSPWLYLYIAWHMEKVQVYQCWYCVSLYNQRYGGHSQNKHYDIELVIMLSCLSDMPPNSKKWPTSTNYHVIVLSVQVSVHARS